MAASPPTATVERQLAAQLKMYKAMDRPDNDDNPLDWWKLNKEKIPLVANLARKYLCIPATSAPSERVFSTAGNNVTFSRYNLGTENIKRLIMIHENLPRVYKTITSWKLTLAESEKFMDSQASQTQNEGEEDEDEDEEEASQSQSLLH